MKCSLFHTHLSFRKAGIVFLIIWKLNFLLESMTTGLTPQVLSATVASTTPARTVQLRPPHGDTGGWSIWMHSFYQKVRTTRLINYDVWDPLKASKAKFEGGLKCCQKNKKWNILYILYNIFLSSPCPVSRFQNIYTQICSIFAKWSQPAMCMYANWPCAHNRRKT